MSVTWANYSALTFDDHLCLVTKATLGRKGLFWLTVQRSSPSWGWVTARWQAWGRGLKQLITLHLHCQQGRQQGAPLLSCFLLLQFRTQGQGVLWPTVRVGHAIPINLTKTTTHRHAQLLTYSRKLLTGVPKEWSLVDYTSGWQLMIPNTIGE